MMTASIFSFETGVPMGFSTSTGSSLTISKERFRDGRGSLRWDYSPGARLTISAEIGFQPFVPNPIDQAISTFGIWVYSEKPSDQGLKFVFGNGEREDCQFAFGLRYSGWRTARVAFERDMIGDPRSDMNTITIYAPEREQGTLFFDQLITCTPVDPRHHTRDEQVPFVNLQADVAANSHWLSLLRMKEALDAMVEKFSLCNGNASYTELEDLHLIRNRWDQYLMQSNEGQTKELSAIEEFYRSLYIERLDGRVIGRTVDVVHFKEFYPESEREALLEFTDAADIRDVTDVLLDIALRYRSTEQIKEKVALRTWFLDIAEHLEDQGWASGSSQGTVHHLGYNMIGLYPSYYLMRDVLREEGVLDRSRRMLEWYSGLGKIAYSDEEIEGNADIFNTTLAGMMSALLLTDEEHIAILLLQRLNRWLELSILPSHGLKAVFKLDGAAYHHVNHYPAYALGGLLGLTPVVRILGGTAFRLPTEAHETIRKVLFAMRFYSNKSEWLISLSSRHPTGKWALVPEIYGEMALAGTPDGEMDIDREMASAYLRLLPEGTDNERSRLLRAAGIDPEPDPNGHWTMNFASAAYHRREGWLAGVRGFSRYIWGNETYVNCNLYGRYIAYGHLEIMGSGKPVNHADSGYVPEGWNWNRWPGTTAIHLPFEKLRADVRNVDSFSGFEEMLISDETYAGGLSLNGRNGMFAMKLHEHAKYDGSHRARKSYFFFDNRIIALGSDIENDDMGHETETTLFQRHLQRRDDPLITSAEGELREFPYESSVDTDQATWVMDVQGNGFVVPAGQKLSITRLHQTSPHQKDDSPTEGDFATAWLSHGRAPQGAKYEFAILVLSNREAVERFAKTLETKENAAYVVLQQDRQAHIVFDRESRTTAYALFEASSEPIKAASINNGRVISTNTPCMVMIQECEMGDIHMSVADPDLRLYDGIENDQYDETGRQREVSLYSRSWVFADGKDHLLNLHVRGAWTLQQPDDRVRISYTAIKDTVFTISCKDAVGVEMRLTPAQL